MSPTSRGSQPRPAARKPPPPDFIAATSNTTCIQSVTRKKRQGTGRRTTGATARARGRQRPNRARTGRRHCYGSRAPARSRCPARPALAGHRRRRRLRSRPFSGRLIAGPADIWSDVQDMLFARSLPMQFRRAGADAPFVSCCDTSTASSEARPRCRVPRRRLGRPSTAPSRRCRARRIADLRHPRGAS